MRREITEHAASKSAEVSIARPPPKAEGILAGHEPTLSPNASAADIHLLFNFSDRIALDWVIDDLIHARATFVDRAPENQFCEVIPVTLPFKISPCPYDDRNSFEGHSVQVGMHTLDNGIRVVAVAERTFNTLSDLANSRLIAPERSGINAATGTVIVTETIIGVQVLCRTMWESGAEEKEFRGNKAKCSGMGRLARPPAVPNTHTLCCGHLENDVHLSPAVDRLSNACVLAKESAVSDLTSALMWPGRRRRSTSRNRARVAAVQPHRLSSRVAQNYGNEEASSGGLGAWSAHNSNRALARKESRHVAVTPSRTVEISIADWPLRFSGPNVGFLRAVSRDSGRLRGDSVRLGRDDGWLALYRRLFVGI